MAPLRRRPRLRRPDGCDGRGAAALPAGVDRSELLGRRRRTGARHRGRTAVRPGLGSLFGRTGLAIGAGLAVLVGNPLSGLTSAPEMLPAGWGTFGQLLPQGATATLLRSTAYFGCSGANSA